MDNSLNDQNGALFMELKNDLRQLTTKVDGVQSDVSEIKVDVAVVKTKVDQISRAHDDHSDRLGKLEQSDAVKTVKLGFVMTIVATAASLIVSGLIKFFFGV